MLCTLSVLLSGTWEDHASCTVASRRQQVELGNSGVDLNRTARADSVLLLYGVLSVV